MSKIGITGYLIEAFESFPSIFQVGPGEYRAFLSGGENGSVGISKQLLILVKAGLE